ncbi:hypothetical protein [Bacteroides sp. GM023]|uniref:hypothetical protein n=1 Tax=Bacteroides sp. GM023 TaxID=2723058 RepID=UPI00168AA526|nr:hypothetical protein [Bacteroides sp. GM023]MBD3590298.1 hypothetical protein [Bacteroides sp. GM023]
MKYKSFKYLVSCLMLWHASQAFSQVQFYSDETVLTPQTWSFMKYGDTPVNMYTGTISTSIPVYTYHDNDFDLPVSLTYASDGYRANTQTGIVGQGWFLNAGASITREIWNMPDESRNNSLGINGYYYYHKNVTVDKNLSSYKRGKQYRDGGKSAIDEPFVYLANPSAEISSKYETEPDIFHFNFMGHRGKFQFDINRNIQVYGVENGSKADFKIECFNFDSPGKGRFIITTNDGYKYVFGGDGTFYDREWSGEANSVPNNVVAWQLTKIIAPNGRKITLKYRDGDWTERGYVQSWRPGTRYEGAFNTELGNTNHSTAFHITNTHPTYLEEIIVDNGCRISFTYTAKEAETYGHSFRSEGLLPALLKLSSIVVNPFTASAGQERTRCDLSYEYAMGNKVMFLKKADLGKNGIYEMDYNGLSSRIFPPHAIYGMDHWGYFNGKVTASSSDFIPNTENETSLKETIIGMGRNPDEKSSLLGMLTYIKYPTGGYTKYEYEGHRYSKRYSDIHSFVEFSIPNPIGTQGELAGGARIKRITDYSEGKECMQREFLYENPDSTSSGILLSMPRYRLVFHAAIFNMTDNRENRYVYKGVVQSLAAKSLDDTHIGYSRVVEKRKDVGDTEYKYADYESYFDENDPSLNPLMFNSNHYIQGTMITSDNAWTIRNLLSEPLSHASSRGQLLSVKKRNTGWPVQTEEFIYSRRLPWSLAPGISNIKSAGDVYYEMKTNTEDSPLVYKKTTKMYGKSTPQVVEETYAYNASAKPVKIAKTVNNGLILSERRQYIEDMSELTDAERIMKDSFQVGLAIKTLQTVQKSPKDKEYVLKGSHSVFSRYGNTILPQLEEVRETELKNPVEWNGFDLDYSYSELHNDHYDSHGNVLQQTDQKGLTTTYLWGYNHLYLVAIIHNATITEVENILGSMDAFADTVIPDFNKIKLLRQSLPQAHISSYAYQPLVGMTERTDARGVTTYYEYDSEGRLTCVKGNDRKTINRYDYHYAGQTE